MFLSVSEWETQRVYATVGCVIKLSCSYFFQICKICTDYEYKMIESKPEISTVNTESRNNPKLLRKMKSFSFTKMHLTSVFLVFHFLTASIVKFVSVWQLFSIIYLKKVPETLLNTTSFASGVSHAKCTDEKIDFSSIITIFWSKIGE